MSALFLTMLMLQARKQELRAVKQYLNDMMFEAKSEYLALRFEEQQVQQTAGIVSRLALPSTAEPESSVQHLPLALPPAQGAANQERPSASHGMQTCK